jgi:Entner-Doudoroff aldolase
MTARKEDTLSRLREGRISAIIRSKDRNLARNAITAAIDGGFRIVEFTLTTPDALGLISEFSKRDDLLVGAGTVLTREDVRMSIDAGARFLVSPVCDPDIINDMNEQGAVSVPGTHTPTEMYRATQVGADIVKLFPAPANVVEYVASILGPLPDLRIFPTAGVDERNFPDVLKAGAFGVGFVRSLFAPVDLANGNFAAIEMRAQRITTLLAGFHPD